MAKKNEDIYNRATIGELREFCNIVRKAGGANVLDALLPAIPQDSSSCLIARNLNFSCQVEPCGETIANLIPAKIKKKFNLYRHNPWMMVLHDEDLAERIASAIGSCVVEISLSTNNTTYNIPLPYKISNCAEAFDDTYDVLDGVFSSYEYAELDEEMASLIELSSIRNKLEYATQSIVYGGFESVDEAISDIHPQIKELYSDLYKELVVDIHANWS